jgi:hypothetical protein
MELAPVGTPVAPVVALELADVGSNVVEIVDDVRFDEVSATDVVGVDVAPTSADPGAIVTVADGCVGLESAMACVAVADSTMDGVPCAVVGVDVALTGVAVALCIVFCVKSKARLSTTGGVYVSVNSTSIVSALGGS